MSKYLPVANPTRSFWLSVEDDGIKGYRSTEHLPKEVDAVIVGSGYAGTATAYYLLKGNPSNKSILMLEARNICNGATARNGGHLKSDLYYGWKRLGKDMVRKMLPRFTTLSMIISRRQKL